MTAPGNAGNDPRGICVMGRRAFGTGIGHLTASLVELLARRYDVAVHDLRSPVTTDERVVLPSGREVLVTADPSGYAVYVFADVLWNGVGYSTYQAPPDTGYRIALLAYDSDELPPEWVAILNRDFDAVLFTSDHLVDVAERSGVQIEIGALPLALDVEGLVSRPYRPVAGRRVRFGTLSAYHPRKGLEALVAAFLDEFGDSDDAELVIHSNVAIGPTAAAVRSMIEVSRSTNVVMSTSDLSDEDKDVVLDTFDVYVNASAGEGFSVGPREALALGKVVVATELGAHAALFGVPGVFPVGSSHARPALYPEIDNRQFGMQRPAEPASLRARMREAFDFARSPEAAATSSARKARGAEYSFAALERSYWAAVDPGSRSLRPGAPLSPHAQLPAGQQRGVAARGGVRGSRLGATRITVPAHDAGFFSLFNTYLTHLTWSMHDSPQRSVLPDWDARRLLERTGSEQTVSFCYSRPDQGNLWNHLFAPPYDLEPADLDDEELLWGEGAEAPVDLHNASREPLLTYIHAYELYRSPAFGRIRRQYNAVLDQHVHLLPHLQRELDDFLAEHRDGRFMVSAHIKHPSHAVEQPDGSMADRHAYVDHVRQAVTERGIALDSEDWTVFLATEQERVVDLFREEFGDRVVRFADVERIPTEVDDRFDELPDQDKKADGHQLQHIMAASTDLWSPRLAWEVIRDAKVMAAADVMFHAVSNVATAASFFNPDVDMRFIGV